MRIFRTAAHWLFTVCFSLLLLTSTIHLVVTSLHIYEYGFDKYHISQVTGIDETQLSEVARRLVDYFSSEVETPQMKVVNNNGDEFELFHDYELIHLQDVKGLFELDYQIQTASLAYVVIYALLPPLALILRERGRRRISFKTGFLLWGRGRWKDLAREIRQGCALTLILIAIAGIASLFGFERLFIRFHYLVFSNPYWMLDPSKDYLIMLFPGGFWQDIAFLGGIAIAVEALLLGGIAWTVPFIHQRRRR
ncbi:MAG: DUF1461 domain-containing protein [Dehalococcoidia bacterium]|nr:DUF1461 domain-containing protein [Dehalococcoidia bacterium]